MPQLIALGLVGGLVWYGYRAFKKQMEKVGEELKNAEGKAAMKNVDALEKGQDGVYRPKSSKGNKFDT